MTFMAKFERKELGIMDSTAFMSFKTCPRLYFYRHVLGFTPSETQPYFAWGSAYHKYREHLELEYRISPDDLMLCGTNALKVALSYFQKHMVTPAPDSKWSFMNRERFIRSCQIAFAHWVKEKQSKRIVVLEVEQAFTLILPDGTPIAGRADQIVMWGNQVWGRDWKTSSAVGKYYENSLNPNDQFTRYTYAESRLRGYDFANPNANPKARVQGQIIEVLQNSKSTGPVIETYTTDRTPSEINTWLSEHRMYMDWLTMCREKDMWPKNEKSCRFCSYRSVCTQSSESSMMTQLKNNYTVNHWDPTTHGEDE